MLESRNAPMDRGPRLPIDESKLLAVGAGPLVFGDPTGLRGCLAFDWVCQVADRTERPTIYRTSSPSERGGDPMHPMIFVTKMGGPIPYQTLALQTDSGSRRARRVLKGLTLWTLDNAHDTTRVGH